MSDNLLTSYWWGSKFNYFQISAANNNMQNHLNHLLSWIRYISLERDCHGTGNVHLSPSCCSLPRSLFLPPFHSLGVQFTGTPLICSYILSPMLAVPPISYSYLDYELITINEFIIEIWRVKQFALASRVCLHWVASDHRNKDNEIYQW